MDLDILEQGRGTANPGATTIDLANLGLPASVLASNEDVAVSAEASVQAELSLAAKVHLISCQHPTQST